VRVNVLLSAMRRRLGVSGYWSLAGYAKRKVKTAVSFIYDFEESVARSVKERGLDGAICGHIHAAAIKQVDGIAYLNCGDWVDSCTAIVEHLDGTMQLVQWTTTRSPAFDVDDEVEALAPLPEGVLAALKAGEREAV